MLHETQTQEIPAVSSRGGDNGRAITCSAPSMSATTGGEGDPFALPALSVHDLCVARIKLARARMMVRQSPWPIKPKPVIKPVLVYSSCPGPYRISPFQVYAAPIGPKRGAAAFPEMLAAVSRLHKIMPAIILGPSRSRGPSRARQDLAWRMRHLLGMSLPEIGHRLGGRDHTTALVSVRAHQSRIDRGEAL